MCSPVSFDAGSIFCGAAPLVGVPQAGRGPRGESDDHGADRSAVIGRPYYGSRRMAAWLVTQGHRVNRTRAALPRSPSHSESR